MNVTHDDGIAAELLPVFIAEAEEQIAALEQLLLQLEDTPDDRDLLDALFRCAHTIKGSAGVFGLSRVVDFTHHVETLLARLREGQMVLTPKLSTLLLQSNDEIKLLVSSAQKAQAESDEVVSAREMLVQRLRAAAGELSATMAGPMAPASADASSTETGTAIRRWHLSVQFGADTFRHGMDPLNILKYLGTLGCIADVTCDTLAVPELESLDPESCHLAFEFNLDTASTRDAIEQVFSFVREDCVLLLTEPGTPPSQVRSQDESLPTSVSPGPPATDRRQRAGGSATAPDDNGFIRVQANRLDEVIDLLGELVIAGAGASLMARQSRQRGQIEANQRITRLIEGIRNSTLKLRMVPIGETFARFRRVVRDTASELGKDVLLEIVGGDTELDKAVVERIADPLMHLVRNALDHGLETPDQRLAAGKPAQGSLTLAACHESGNILIRISDDGRGIQRDKVLQRAWERGLVEPGVEPPDADILKLIFEAGFSTAEAVTNLSGRGVGMDVVRRNIEALRGSVVLTSEPGQGSIIEIRLPLTLAIIDGFLLGVGASKFILPLDAVVEVIASHTGAATAGAPTTSEHQGRSCVELRGQILPVVNLRTLYGLDSLQPERSSIVVVRSGSRRYGVLVDVLLGQHQTVIKPLGLMLRSLRGISGSSILGTGEVALIFDVGSLGELAAGGAKRANASHTAAPPPHMARSE